MLSTDLQALCEAGQQQLMQMEYVQAEATLATAEAEAYRLRDYDTLSRLYLPLQEARRQHRLRCGEGVVCLDLLAEGPEDHLLGRHVVENYPQGQLLVAGWGSIKPAQEVRKLQAKHGLYLETFLGAVYPSGEERLVVIVPLENVRLPKATDQSREDLERRLPPDCLVLSERELPSGSQRGTPQTLALVQDLWQRLHRPFLARADAEADARRKIDAYRATIQVDYACELAHQNLSDVAKRLLRKEVEPVKR